MDIGLTIPTLTPPWERGVMEAAGRTGPAIHMVNR